MSGPVTESDATSDARLPEPHTAILEVTESRASQVGDLPVRRALPRRNRRTVGAWCFVDHMGPAQVTEDHGLDIGPHPHMGLQTVTWLLSGEVLHRDSLGSEQVIRPGQLNLMTAGHGVSHSEEATGSYRGELHGVQLWVAQPSATRDGQAAFEHHASLPQVEIGEVTGGAAGAGAATVLVGTFAGTGSPARRDTEHVGVELDLRGGGGRVVLPLEPSFEYGLVALEGEVALGDRVLGPGHLGYLGTGREEVVLEAADPARLLLLGGVPFPEPVLMWWHSVARDRAEIVAAHRDWMEGGERFGHFGSPLSRIVTSPPPWNAGR